MSADTVRQKSSVCEEMRGRVSLRLSPNEEAQLEREELHRRRKLRLQQVREQERFIARQVRTQVQERRRQQMQTLADSLQLQWQQQQMLRLQALSTHYQHSLRAVGHGHRSARENEPDLEALAQRSVERQERAEERHREALRELSARRHEEEQQQRRHADARRKALLEEKRRAERVASLPAPPPDPVESIGKKTPRPLKCAAAERFSLTHCHMRQTAVDRETDTEQQLSAQQAAALEIQRLEELRREEARDRQERLEKARLRGNHALRTEQHTQDRARLLCELERLQQADLLRRRQEVNTVPAQIFQPLYRQQELRDEQQRELEIAFQDVCTEERKVKGDLVMQLVPEPLPPLSASSHDEELDVTLDPECAPEGEEPETPGTETAASSAPPADAGRRALSRLLERIRRQRDQRSRQQTADMPVTSRDADTQEEALSVETGSLSSQEKASGGSSEQQTPSTTHTEDAPDVSDEAVVAGSVLPVEERVESERRAHTDQPTHVEVLLRRQQEQLALLEELEEKRRELEQRLRDTQHTSSTLQEAAHRQSTTLPEPPAEVKPDVTHTQRLHQYQQRLLEQNRLHKKCVEEARRRLEEYQRTLKLRYAIGSTSAALPQPSVPLETRSAHSPALPLVLHPDPHVLHPGKAPAPAPSQQPNPSGSESSSQDGQEDRVPLPPPSVLLELLRSRQHHAVPRSAEISASVTASSFGPVQTSVTQLQSEPCVEADRQELRRQRDFLQALITADRQGSALSFSDVQTDRTTLNTLLNAIEEANGHTEPSTAPSQRDRATLTTTLLSDGSVYDPAPVHRGRVKPPVSRPPARLAFLQQMEQHELSAIQEVDTPVNISLDTVLQSVDVSESSSTSLPAVSSEDGHSVSQRSQVTGRISRMSWRETLLCDSTASASPSSMNHQRECFGAVDPDYLSSTTISTGSYSTSDHEPSYAISEASHLCTEPDVCGPSPKSSSCHMTAAQAQEMRDSVQQIIDKYSKELNASLRHAGVTSGAVNTSSASQSWSSALQEECSLRDGDAAERRSSLSSAAALSSTELSGVFQPLQPHPDIDSSSSSSRDAVRDDQSTRAQGWSETVNRILERLSDQLSIRQSEQGHGTTPAEPSRLSSSVCRDQDRHLNESIVRQNRTSHVRRTLSSAEDQLASPDQSAFSQLIGKASDMGSSQVFDQSSVLADGPEEATQSTGPAEVCSSLQPSVSQMMSDDALTDGPQDDASDLFLPLPSDVTTNETADCSTALCVPLEAEPCGAYDAEASDWLESTDQSLTSLQHLRVDTLLQSQPDLQISMDALSFTHESLCDTDAVAPPTAADVSLMPRSPLKPALQEDAPQMPSQEVSSEPPPHLTELLERAQAAGDVKGILEESTISFISLPESTLQDPELTLTQTPDTGSAAQEVGESQSRSDDSQSERPEAAFPHAVMLLEFQSSSAPQQRRRDRLAQRSALRAAQIKARKPTAVQKVSRATGRTDPEPHTAEYTRLTQRLLPADRLKSVAEVRICSDEHRRCEEATMYRRTHRLYNQLEEVKQKKELRSRQESYAKNREKARDFQRKTLEKLRAKLNR
ncbi:centrosomal protein of 295 kDa isoform X3 [Sinocyclocheilus rhinocerous]|uniref:centrosomal protein of 295 kDa isoform X3 n=1 Tax=Sinocyclocheilus rhinocerous TaxID=307959 RepID=UPI0007B90D41|nr:PREDICTED: centrosomal protein of 295 kDa-like isoform X3 [Sinocyclocheilus rhinocerous]